MSENATIKTSFLSDIATDQGKALILSAVSGVAKQIRTDFEWKKIFVDSGKLFIESEDSSELFFDELSKLLSTKSMEELAKKLRSDSGYGIEDKSIEFLVRLMRKYGIPHDRAVVYSKNLLTVILERIRESFPEKYDRFFQSDWREEYHLNYKKTIEKIDNITKQLSEYKQQGIDILSSDNLDQFLMEEFELPYFGISFFEVDDKQFCEYLSNHKTDQKIFVKCKCQEEAIYCVVNELLHQREDRPIFVVKNLESWNALRQLKNRDNIYIPFFWSDEIIAIPNNTNIFVMQEDLPLLSKEYVELRPRTRRTITSCLERAGMNSIEASELVNKNHGLFTLMKRKLINGIYLKKPKWVESIPDEIVKTCLLLCNWAENEGDKYIIEELSGHSFEEFVSIINKYSRGDDPFIVITKRYEKRYYYLANVENSWSYYNISIEESIWRKYIDIFLSVMTQEEELLSSETVLERTYAEILGKKMDWSSLIRSGMVHSLMVKAYFINDENCQPIVNNLVSSILATITDEKRWRFISNYFKELCELAPNIILSRLSKEFEEPTGMISLFTEKTDDLMWGPHYYYNILWSLEQLLLQKEFASKAFEVVLKLDDLSIKYNSNSPREIIRTVLCVWGNFSAFNTANDKTIAANRALKNDKNAWDIILSVLPDNQQTVFGSFSKPLYRDTVERSGVSIQDYNLVVNSYFSLLVKNALFDQEKWVELLDNVEYLCDESFTAMIQSLLDSIVNMDDLKKIYIKNSIREIIHKHRFFNTASWAMGEEKIVQYEKLLNVIEVSTVEYEYAFYFNYYEYDFPLPNPFSIDDDEHISKNEQVAKELIREKTIEFKERNLDLSVLAKCCATREGMKGSKYLQSFLGWYLAMYWDENHFDIDVFSLLLKAQKTGKFAYDYFRGLGKHAVEFFDDALSVAISEGCDNATIVNLYRVEAEYSNGIPAIDKANKEIKDLFWQQYRFGYFDDADWALSACKEHGTCSSFLRLLYYLNEKTHFNSDYLYNHMLIIASLNISEDDLVERHYLSSLLKLIQDDILVDEEKRVRIAQIEVLFSRILDWHDMKCFQYDVKERPDSYTEMLKYIYKTDDGSVPDLSKNNKGFVSYLYQVFSKAKFCPAEENGYVDEDKLEEWIKRFDELLEKNKQTSIRGMILGRLLANSPAGRDGFYPCESVRKVIESSADSEMMFAYKIAVENNRGTFFGTEGEEELALSERFKHNADYLSIEYPKTASIYYGLANSYQEQSIEERRRAEDAF